MITQNLIDLIEKGDAQYKTWVIGATGSSRIPVPKNNYIVITDFHYSHFMDRKDELGAAVDFLESLRNNVHHLTFTSFGQRYLYTIRSSFQMNVWDGNEWASPTVPSTKYDTYQVHKTDVHVDVWRLLDFSKWSLSVSKLDDKTTEEPNPSGYGTQNNAPNQNVLRKINFDGVQQDFLPYGENQGIPLTNTWREQFYCDIDNQSFLHPPDTKKIDCNYTYPIINVGYVLINKTIDKTAR